MTRRSLVLTPQGALVAGGAAEAFEHQVQALYEQGQRHLVVDLILMTDLDSRGVRALVRSHTTGQRLGGTLTFANANARVLSVLQLAGLDRVLALHKSVRAASKRSLPWRRAAALGAAAALSAALVWWERRVPQAALASEASFAQSVSGTDPLASPLLHPFQQVFKLVAAALIGIVVTVVHRPYVPDRPMDRSMRQAQILLCVAGAMVMVIIGNSVARAFGIAGAASIIRFRTPVDDPKDVVILFLLMGLGMAAGVGAFAVAGLGTAFLCAFLMLLDQVIAQRSRTLRVDVIADGQEFPTAHVHSVFVRNRLAFETREVSLGDKTKVRYHATVPAMASLEDLGEELMRAGAGVKSVAWEPVKD
jgi:anti-anti-sigma factor